MNFKAVFHNEKIDLYKKKENERNEIIQNFYEFENWEKKFKILFNIYI